MRYVLLFMVLSFLISCKEKKNSETENRQLVVIEDNELKLIINAEVLVDDVFEVYFYEFGEDTFHSEDFVETKVKGGRGNQDIVFTLPDRIYPERIRLDFGKTPKQKEMKLNSVKFTYNDKAYEFSKEEIVSGFSPSKFMEFNKESMIIRTKEIDSRYDPYLYSKKITNIIDYLIED
ncbi:hypothetical protein [Snuella lapsa]|uniref:Uncharacterized protein n=1 Tax=Snuella lapsa TaxID=870481 RepID=A0ABP6XFJ5_9FLAO